MTPNVCATSQRWPAPLVETFVFGELRKQLSWSATGAELMHFRTLNGHEVDLVLEDRAGRVVGIEVKTAGAVHSDDFRGLRTFMAAAGSKFVRGIVLYNGRDIVPFARNLHAVPVSSLWS